jgi:hypothetical protein
LGKGQNVGKGREDRSQEFGNIEGKGRKNPGKDLKR